ncbi:MAG: Stage V sporulation protein B [Firmicutes bacterium ADurb.Bin193]|nr:MAG: Stage V sporulation protein B [Firmicutes bacterium ADurb.Bin193]
MTQTNKQTFLKGAFILVVSGIFVKILGAGFKIPLTMLIKSDGMGLFNASYTLYAFFVLAAKGISIAVSKMVSESVALGRDKEAERIFIVSFLILGAIGICGTILLYFGAENFAKTFVDSRASLTIRAIAPSVLFITMVSAIRGYFQGKQNMYPTAISEVIEAFGKLAIGIVLAWVLIGRSIESAAAGAITGVTISTFISFMFILIVFIIDRRRHDLYLPKKCRSRRSIVRELVIIALPITIGASVASLTNIVDMLTIMKRLQSITQVTPEFMQRYSDFIDPDLFSGGIYEGLANKLYGLYTGYAVQLFNLPLTMIVALSTSVLPAISGALKRVDIRAAQLTTNSALRITVLFALPCSVGLSVLAGPVLLFIFNESLAASLLRTLSLAIVFVSLVQVTSAILQAYGKMAIPVFNMLIGCLVKIGANYCLVSQPSINIDGAPVSTLLCYFVIAALNIFFIIRITGCRLGVGELILRPVLASGAMAVVVVFAMNVLSDMNFPVRLAVVPAIAVGAVTYALFVFLVGAIKESDVTMLPGGEKLAYMLKKLHLLRAE